MEGHPQQMKNGLVEVVEGRTRCPVGRRNGFWKGNRAAANQCWQDMCRSQKHKQQIYKVKQNKQHGHHCQQRHNNKKSVAVIGSTGKQGGGLVRAILEDVDSRFVTVSTLSFLHATKLREPCRKQDCRVGSPVPGSRAVEFSWLPVGGARPACGVQACVARS